METSTSQCPGVLTSPDFFGRRCRKHNEMWVWSLGWEDPLEEGMATHSNIPAWRIPRTEEPGGPQSLELQRYTTETTLQACPQVTEELALWCSRQRFKPVDNNEVIYEYLSLGNVFLSTFHCIHAQRGALSSRNVYFKGKIYVQS